MNDLDSRDLFKFWLSVMNCLSQGVWGDYVLLFMF